MSRQAGYLGLVHRVDHRRRGAGAPERITNVGNLGNAGALAAEFGRHGNTQKTLFTRSRYRLRREPRPGINRSSMRGCNGRNFLGTNREAFGAGKLLIAGNEQAARRAARSGNARQRCCSRRHEWVLPLFRNRISIAIPGPEVTQNFEFVAAIG